MGVLKSILQFVVGCLLLLIAIIIIRYTFIIGLVAIVITNVYRARFWGALVRLGDVFTAIAYCIDVLGCVVLQVPLNLLFITKVGYKFGVKKDTISYVLGINQQDETLTKTGRYMCWLLDLIDTDHCKKAVQKNEYK